MKCEVLRKINIVVEEGSIVNVDPRQFELARAYLKPIVEEEPKKKERKKKSEEAE